MHKMIKSNKGQNTIEYMLMIAVVIGVLLVAVRQNGFIAQRVDQSLGSAVSGIECMVENIDYGGIKGPSICP